MAPYGLTPALRRQAGAQPGAGSACLAHPRVDLILLDQTQHCVLILLAQRPRDVQQEGLQRSMGSGCCLLTLLACAGP